MEDEDENHHLEAERPVALVDVAHAEDERDDERVDGVNGGDDAHTERAPERQVDAYQVDLARVGRAHIPSKEGSQAAVDPPRREDEWRCRGEVVHVHLGHVPVVEHVDASYDERIEERRADGDEHVVGDSVGGACDGRGVPS